MNPFLPLLAASLFCLAPQAWGASAKASISHVRVTMPDARVRLDLSRPDTRDALRGLYGIADSGRGVFLRVSGEIEPRSELDLAVQTMMEDNPVAVTSARESSRTYRVSGDRLRGEGLVISHSFFAAASGRLEDVRAFGREFELTLSAAPAQLRRIAADLRRQGATVRPR